MFVSNDDNVFKRKVIVRVVLIYPLVQVKERVFIGDVKDQDTAMSSSVVGCSNVSESFLASCVPDLQTYFLILKVKCP